MNYTILGLLFIFTLISGGIGWGMWWLMKSASKLHDKIANLKELADSAETKEELLLVWDQLKIVSKECFHRSFSSGIIEVKTIIETKIKMLSKIKN